MEDTCFIESISGYLHTHAVQSLSQSCKGEVGLRPFLRRSFPSGTGKIYKSLHLHLLFYLKQSTVFTAYYIDKHLVIIMVILCLVQTGSML